MKLCQMLLKFRSKYTNVSRNDVHEAMQEEIFNVISYIFHKFITLSQLLYIMVKEQCKLFT